MILTDGVHLISNYSIEELHSFAEDMGLKREWFQEKRILHYDLTTTRAKNRAIEMGAILVSSREIVSEGIRRFPIKLGWLRVMEDGRRVRIQAFVKRWKDVEPGKSYMYKESVPYLALRTLSEFLMLEGKLKEYFGKDMASIDVEEKPIWAR